MKETHDVRQAKRLKEALEKAWDAGFQQGYSQGTLDSLSDQEQGRTTPFARGIGGQEDTGVEAAGSGALEEPEGPQASTPSPDLGEATQALEQRVDALQGELKMVVDNLEIIWRSLARRP